MNIIDEATINNDPRVNDQAFLVEQSFLTIIRDRTQIPQLERHLLSITCMFRQNAVSIDADMSLTSSRRARTIAELRRAAYPRHPMVEFKLLYFKAMQTIIGNNIGRYRHLQPPTFAWIDWPISRKGRLFDKANAHDPHIHALSLCDPAHPDIQSEFEDLLNSEIFRQNVVPSAASVHVEKFDSNKGSLRRLASYCSKGYTNIYLSEEKKMELNLCAMLPG